MRAARPINSIDFFIIRWVLGYFHREHSAVGMVPGYGTFRENYSSGGGTVIKGKLCG
ncbi:hypothetical protein BACSTE_02797 [Bacteroides stercoris ATCC 43183]|jgi:hypothetical protein|uniref:Uncharacterized protein n=1 Tax=Bacteroides stercoris ATCC 43183 TaxID=449673 RepID=B0NTH5_BACSE|nr:hypothetical protein BACSTE_02797 [Bacteroides stercoris ATCC 43183]